VKLLLLQVRHKPRVFDGEREYGGDRWHELKQ